jgi:hypothetical protein
MLREFFRSRRLGMGRVLIYWNSAGFHFVHGLPRLPMRKTLFLELWGIAVIFVKSQLSSKSLCSWVLTVVCIFIECVACMYSLYIILLRIGGSVIEGSTRLRAATVRRTDSDISTTCYKRSGRRGEFVLTASQQGRGIVSIIWQMNSIYFRLAYIIRIVPRAVI